MLQAIGGSVTFFGRPAPQCPPPKPKAPDEDEKKRRKIDHLLHGSPSWQGLAGRAGIALVRNGAPVKILLGAMN